MPKRFTDSDKWKKPFIRSLEAPYKLLWFYILDDCDHAGIWQVDIEVAQIKIGEKIDIKKAEDCLKEKIVIFDNREKWFIPDFIEFQYGQLNENNRVHNSVLLQLRKYKLNKGLKSSLQGAKDKEQDKNKVKDKVKNKEEKFKEQFEPFLEKYSKETLNEFYKYWTEPNKSKTKLRWEMEKTWDISRRLARWDSNKFGKNEGQVTYTRKELPDDYYEPKK